MRTFPSLDVVQVWGHQQPAEGLTRSRALLEQRSNSRLLQSQYRTVQILRQGPNLSFTHQAFFDPQPGAP
jgi:hypothetical protein